MHLNIQGTKHPIRPGLSLIGSVANERFNTILLQDRSICPKHASLRFDTATNKLEILDLCSIEGVSVNQNPIEPLIWNEITTLSRLNLGRVPISIETDSSNRVDEPSFLHDEDSTDVIDCSLEETAPSTLQGSRKMAQTTVGLLTTSARRSSLIEITATVHQQPPPTSSLPVVRNSFLVPETQQFNDSVAACSKPKPTPVPSNCDPSADALNDDDEDFFFIPETQQPEDELACPSEVYGRIGCEVAETPAQQTATEDEYFQMTADNDDNSNDAMFNNKYVEESQNLLKSLDVSCNGGVVAAPRGSILPDRSMDSISFQEHRNTTLEMSRIEWNESKKEHEQSTANEQLPRAKGGLEGRVEEADKADDRSITPELHFDDDLPVETVVKKALPVEETGGSKVDPVPAANRLTAMEEANRASVTPELHFDDQENVDDEHEISLNQEGCIKPNALTKDDETRTANVYELETQAFAEEDPYGLLTQPLQRVDKKSESVLLAQQRPVEEDPYELQTQPMGVEKPAGASKPTNKSPFLMPALPAVQSKGNRTPEVDYANMPTQPFSPPEFLYQPEADGGTNGGSESPCARLTRKSPFKRQTSTATALGKGNRTPEIDYANLPTQPFTPPELLVQPADDQADRGKQSLSAPSIDDDDLLTQPLSPPKEQMDTPVLYRAASAAAFDPYNLDTQPFEPATTDRARERFEKKTPILKLVDLKACLVGSSIDSDVSGNNRQSLINSTTHMSLVQAQQGTVEPGVEISPTSSNKENHTSKQAEREKSHDTDDDELGMAETLPIETLFPHKPKPDGRGKPFKMPLTKADTLATPKARKNEKRRSVEMTEFLTPEHPMLFLPKADVIRSVSDQMRRSGTVQPNTSKAKPKYHFNDSSSSGSDDDENSASGRLAFKKTNVSVALEKELANVREVGKMKKQQERDLAREKNPSAKEADDGKKEAQDRVKPRDEDKRSKRAASTRTAQRKASEEVEQPKAAEPSKLATRRRASKDVERTSEPKKKSSRTTAAKEERPEERTKRSHHSANETNRRSEARCSTERAKPSTDVGTRASTRNRRDTYKKRMLDESVDYLPDSAKNPSAVAPVSTRASRKRKEDDEFTAEDRVSRHQTTAALEPKRHKSEADVKERTRRAASSSRRTSKVVGPSSDLFEERGKSSEDLTNDSATGGNTTEESDASSVSAARSVRPRLIFTKMNPEPYRQCIARAGGKIVDMPELATILVTDHIIRTYKFLCSVAKGIPIVGQSYLDALQRSNGTGHIDPWDHILSDPVKEKRYEFNLRETLLKAKRHKLFQDYTVFVTASTQPPPSELCLILSCAGAKISKHCSQPPKDASKLFVISDPADSASWPKYREKCPTIEIVSAEGFMLSIMQHSINFRKFRLA